MALVNIYAYVQGHNLESQVVFNPVAKTREEKLTPHMVKFVMDFENPIYKEMTFDDIIGWIARVTNGDFTAYAKAKSIHLSRPITVQLTQEEAFNLGFITEKQRTLVKQLGDLDQNNLESEIKQHEKSGWVIEVSDLGFKVLKKYPSPITVWTGEFKRSRREIGTIDDIRTLKDNEILEVVPAPFEDVPCEKCGAKLNESVGISLKHNRVICRVHLNAIARRMGIKVIDETNIDKLIHFYIQEGAAPFI